MAELIWEPARLIPVSGIGGAAEQERRASSALLAVLGAVDEFGRALLKPLGAPAGRVTAFTEVPFELTDGRKVRVDGLVRVERGKRQWTLLVEVKTGSSEHSQDQVEAYLQAVREQGFDGLLTIGNQIVSIPGVHPVSVSKKRYGRIHLYHLSWSRILSVAMLTRDHTGVSDPDQSWILSELIRYLDYDGSGALDFDDMGQSWTAARNAIRNGTAQPQDKEMAEVAARWDQLVQFCCLGLSARLGSQVSPYISRKEFDDPSARATRLASQLATAGTIDSTFVIPDTVGSITVGADIARLTAWAEVDVAAPDLKRSTARLNWLLRQLPDAADDVRVDIAFANTRTTASEMLSDIRENPRIVLLEGKLPRSFKVVRQHRVGGNRKTGRKGFITDVLSLVDSFYQDVVQNLTSWQRPAPELKSSPSRADSATEEEIDSLEV